MINITIISAEKGSLFLLDATDTGSSGAGHYIIIHTQIFYL